MDVKKYFSGKHHDYGLKVETAHWPDGTITTYSPHHHGSKHDFQIFKDRVDEYRKLLVKTEAEKNIPDDGPLHDRFPNSWLLIADSAYAGAQHYLRAAVVQKRSDIAHRPLNVRTMNSMLSCDRVIVENFYGRMLSLFGVRMQVYEYDHTMYDTFFRCVAPSPISICARTHSGLQESMQIQRDYPSLCFI